MINYNAPLTLEEQVDVILNGIFLNQYMRADIKEEIIDEVRERIKKNKMPTTLSCVQNAVCETLYYRIVK